MGLRERHLDSLRQFLFQNVGRFIEGTELSALFNQSYWPAAITEFRDHEGLDLILGKDGETEQYRFVLLKNSHPVPSFSKDIPSRTRKMAIKDGDLHCKMCGRENGDKDPTTQGRLIRLFVTQLMPSAMWKGLSRHNLESTCIACREGLSGRQLDRPTARTLKSDVRRARAIDQLDTLKWLVSKFPKQAKLFLDG